MPPLSSRVSGSCFCVARSVLLLLSLLTTLIGFTLMLLAFRTVQSGMTHDVPDAFAVRALHVTAVLPRPCMALPRLAIVLALKGSEMF